MSDFDFDLFTIGAGSGGVRASRVAAQMGAKVAVAEKSDLGGTCVNLGCIPKKLFSYAAHFAEDFEDAQGFGWKSQRPEFDWNTLLENKNREIERLNGIYRRILENNQVKVIDGAARVIDSHTVEVAGQRYTSKYILVAVGGIPSRLEVPGGEWVLNSNDAFHHQQLPRSVVVVGGGYIAVEFAGIYAALGVKTTLLHRGELVLRGFDKDIRAALGEHLTASGVNLQLQQEVVEVQKLDDGLSIKTNTGDSYQAEAVLSAVGRTPATPDLGLKDIGVSLGNRGEIIVDDSYRTSVDSIYAIGDVINRVTPTPVAIHEAMTLVDHLFGNSSKVVDYDNIPSAVFSQPPIGVVGLSEGDAKKKHGEIDVYESSFRPLKATLSGAQGKTYMKLIVDKASDKVVGVHMLGPDAPEIMQGFSVALKTGATKADFDSTVGIHPTAAEELVTMRTPRPD